MTLQGELSGDRQDVADLSYRTVIDPEMFDSLERSWEKFVDDAFASTSPDVRDQRRIQNIEQAHALLIQLGRRTTLSNSAQELVDTSPGIGIVADVDGHVLARNSDAEKFFGPVAAIRGQALDRFGLGGLRNWMIRRNDNRHHYFFTAFDAENMARVMLASRITIDPDDAMGHIFVTEIDLLLNDHILTEIEQAFSLTRAESEVCLLLSNGYQPNEIALRRAVSIHTVRTQIKSAIEKSGARSATDLVRSLCGLAARISFLKLKTSAALAKTSQTMPEPDFVLLPDGRRIAYFEHGDPNGQPILYLPTLFNGPTLLPWQNAMFARRGLRLISLSMPGYGTSDPQPADRGEHRLSAFAADLDHFRQTLKLPSIVVIGQHYALRYAAQYPDRVRGLIFWRNVPHWTEAMLDRLTPRRRNLIKTSQRWPGSVRFLARIAMAMIDSGRAEIFLRGLAKGAPRNEEILNDPEFMANAIESCRHNVTQGIGAFCDDVPLLHHDSSADLVRVRCPVWVVDYRDGGHCPPDAIAALKSMVPDTRILLVEGHGIACYRHLCEQLAAAASAADKA